MNDYNFIRQIHNVTKNIRHNLASMNINRIESEFQSIGFVLLVLSRISIITRNPATECHVNLVHLTSCFHILR